MFREALTEIVRRVEQAKARGLVRLCGLIGGFAVSAWGVPRATRDIDFALALGSSDLTALSALLGGDFHQGGPDDPLRGVFRTTVAVEGQTIPVQLIVLPPEWTELVFRRLELLSIQGCSLSVISWQALILLKLYAGGLLGDPHLVRRLDHIRNILVGKPGLLGQARIWHTLT